MKILFAVSNEKISESITKKYESIYKEIVSSKNVYYFNAILKELQKDKSYDRVVVSEDLEPFTNKNYEITDNFIFEKLDRISDEAVDHSGEDIPIILIASDRRTKGEAILNKLFGIGIYSALIGADRTIQNLCELINKPRSKKEAKIYYRIDATETDYKPENEDNVSETEIQNILAYYKKLGKNEDKYVESFNTIANQYTDQQLKVIIKFLPIGVKAVLEANSPKYQQLATFSGETANLKNQKPYASSRVNPRTNKPRSTENAIIDNGIKIEPIGNKEVKRPSKPVVIPQTLSTQNVKKIQKNTNTFEQKNVKERKEPINNETINKIVEEPVNEPEEIVTNDNIYEEERVMPMNIENENLQPKRGRGRPKKILTPEEIAAAEAAAKLPKRGRGRPKKFQPEQQEEVETVLSDLDELDEEQDSILPGFEEEPKELDFDDFEDFEIEEPKQSNKEEKYEEDIVEPVLDEEDEEQGNYDDILEFEDDNWNDDEIEQNNNSEKNAQNIENLEDDEDDFLPGIDTIEEDNVLSFDEPTLPGFEETERNLSNNTNNYQLNNNEPVQARRPSYDDIINDNEQVAINNSEQSIKEGPNTQEEQKQIKDYNAQDSNLSNLLTSNKKIVAFVGTSKNGTSFLVNNIADMFSKQGIKTAIVDLTKNKNAYYIYTKNEESLRKTAIECMNKLAIGTAQGVQVNRNLDVYTSLPGENSSAVDEYAKILETLVQNYSLILLDCDFNTNYGYLREAQEIYLVQSMDVLTIQPLTAYLRDLKAKNVLAQEKLRIVINKYTRVRSVTEKTIIGGMAFYNDPSMSYMTELFNRETIRYSIIPFEPQTYSKYLEGLVNCNITTDGYSKEFTNYLRKLANMVYPLVTNNNVTKQNKYNKNTNNTFSNNINSTLDKMRGNY